MSKLRMEEVTLAYEEFSTSVPADRITSVVGPNGCGKSTLLRIVGVQSHKHHCVTAGFIGLPSSLSS